MQIAFTTFTVRKRFPLTISRGTTAETTNLWVRIEAEGIEGWGEPSRTSAIAVGLLAMKVSESTARS
jgi:L-alanine-DL-glutamate epimerase-like enolase superfamily enzyme